MKESNNEVEVSVSDPTQINTGVINLEINKSVSGALKVDEGIVVTQTNPTIKLSVNVNQAKGKTFKVVFSKS
jgi:hyaluronate lyase